VEPKTGMDRCGKYLPPPAFDHRTVQPRSQLLYRLRYPAYFWRNAQRIFVGFFDTEEGGKNNSRNIIIYQSYSATFQFFVNIAVKKETEKLQGTKLI
jgi:hypothetical protein